MTKSELVHEVFVMTLNYPTNPLEEQGNVQWTHQSVGGPKSPRKQMPVTMEQYAENLPRNCN